MKKLKATCLSAIILFTMSCTSLKYQIKRNDAFTKKVVSEILRDNDNVFYLTTEFSNASLVWTYEKDVIQIFKLINGSVSTERKYELLNGSESIIHHSEENFNNQIFECSELDGDLIEIRIKNDGDIEKYSFPVNLECFTEREYESTFLTRVAGDMRKYNIRW